MIAFFLSMIFIYTYWFINHNTLDLYDTFIFGDTINSLESKQIDLKLIPYFILFLAGSFFLLEKFNVLTFFFESGSRSESKISSLKRRLNNSWMNKFIFFLKIIAALFFSYYTFKILALLGFADDGHILFRNIFIISIICFSALFKQRFILVSQIGLCLSPLLFLSETYKYNGEIISFSPSLTFTMLMVGLTTITFLITLKEIKDNTSTVSTAFIIFVLTLIIGGLRRFYCLDEYHNGELFTAYHQIFELNQHSYSEFIPTKGFMHLIVGFINANIFEGGYITIAASIQVTKLLFGFFLVLFLKMFYRQEKILFLILLSLPIFGNYYPIIIGLLLLSSKKNTNDDYLFLLSYVYFSFIFFIYYNAFGIAFAVSLLPVMIYRFYSAIKNKRPPRLFHYVLFVLGLGLFAISFNLIFSSIQYVLNNSSANLLYWGNYGTINTLITSNLWVITLIALLILAYKNKIKLSSHNSIWLSFFTLFPFVILSYLEGRSDGTFDRANSFTFTYSVFLFAFVINRSSELSKKVTFLLFIIAFIPFVVAQKLPFFTLTNSSLNSFKIVHVNSHKDKYVSNSSLPKLGNGFIDKDRYEEIELEYKLIKKLYNDETFLIIGPYASQAARYSIYNKRVPIKSHSLLNIPSLKLQSDELKKLKNENVKIIRLSKGINRHHLFHKYIFSLDWRVIKYNKKEYLISPDLLARIEGNLDFDLIELALDTYSTKDFGPLPIKWGGAFENEQENLSTSEGYFEFLATHEIKNKNNDSYAIPDTPPDIVYRVIDPTKLMSKDLITFKLQKSMSDICSAQFFWSTDTTFTEKNSVRFKVSNGYNTVPIGMNLNWKFATEITKIRIDFDVCENQDIKIDSILISDYKYN